MKKIISLLFVFVMLFACAAPTYAEDFQGSTNINNDAVYDGISLYSNATVVVNCNVEIQDGVLYFSGSNTLQISEHGSLIGNNLMFFIYGNNNSISLSDGGFINLSFMSSTHTNKFEQLLKDSNIDYVRSGDHIVAGCPHSEWKNSVCTRCGIPCPHETYENGVCAACGHECKNEFHNGAFVCPDCGMEFDPTQGNPLVRGSTISEGNLAIITAVAGIAVGMAAMFFIMKKKPAVAGGASAEDEE